jgi:hypothetical protein
LYFSNKTASNVFEIIISSQKTTQDNFIIKNKFPTKKLKKAKKTVQNIVNLLKKE